MLPTLSLKRQKPRRHFKRTAGWSLSSKQDYDNDSAEELQLAGKIVQKPSEKITVRIRL